MSFTVLVEAVDFAAKAHKNQRRKNVDKTPYINHPISVMQIVSEATLSIPIQKRIPILCAAVLHDTVEDTDTTLNDLKQQFGRNIASYVDEVSDDKSLPKAERKRLQIEHATKASDGAKIIKIADALDNMHGLLGEALPVGWTSERVRGYCLWKFFVLQACRGVNKVLDNKVDDFYRLATLCIDGVLHPLLPPEDQRQELLEAYYLEMSQVDD